MRFGVSASGKTWRIQRDVPAEEWTPENVYQVPTGTGPTLWWTGYKGQTVVWFEEFKGKESKLSLSLFKELLDDNQTPRRVKITNYEEYPFQAKYILFTSQQHPRTWWPDEFADNEEWRAVQRRFGLGVDGLDAHLRGCRMIEHGEAEREEVRNLLTKKRKEVCPPSPEGSDETTLDVAGVGLYTTPPLPPPKHARVGEELWKARVESQIYDVDSD